MIRNREVSARELTELVLDRIDAVNPKLNAVVELRREAALREAAAADQATARGGQVGSLDGVPMTIKEGSTSPGCTPPGATGVQGVRRRPGRHRGPAAAAGRRHYPWRHQRGVHARRLRADQQRPVRHDRQPVGLDPHAGWLLRRLGVDALARAGATITEGWPDGIDPGQSSESFGFHVGLYFAFLQPGEDLPPLAAVIEEENRRMAVRAAWPRL
jgi:Amidase